MKPFKTAPVNRAQLAHYRKRAEDCVRLSEMALPERLWFGTCINAVHAGIALADCLSIFLRGTRYAGSSHDEAIQFYATLQITKPEFRQSVQNLAKLISIKHASEYADQALTEQDAQTALKTLHRFINFVKEMLPK